MGNGVYSAVAGSVGQMMNLDVMANNLAHINTTGFKSDLLIFEKKLADADGGRHSVDTPTTAMRLTQGTLRRTDNPLDIAIQGEGFLVVDTPVGTKLTRAGRMVIGEDRLLHTASGHKVHGESDFIRVPNPHEVESSGPIVVDKSGTVHMGKLELGRIRRVDVPRETLSKAGHDAFNTTVPLAYLPPATSGYIVQGHLESANVNAVKAMTQIIGVQRTYEALQQVVKTYRDVDSQSLRRAR